jgi:hypothetical protein
MPATRREETADMRVLITAAPATGVSIAEPDDTKRLAVATPLTDPEQIAAALEEVGAGQLAGQHVWLDIDFLRRTATPADPASWASEFDAMIRYADRRGWVSEDGRQVRAHVESTEQATR